MADYFPFFVNIIELHLKEKKAEAKRSIAA